MTNNEVITPENPVVKLVVRQSSFGLIQVVAKTKLPTESGEDSKIKVLSKISLKDVINSPFFVVGGEDGIILGKPGFCDSLKKICEELRINIDVLTVRTMDNDSAFPYKIIITQSLDDIDSKSPEWEATFVKQVEMVVKLLNGTRIE